MKPSVFFISISLFLSFSALAQPVATYTYGYDNAGNRTSKSVETEWLNGDRGSTPQAIIDKRLESRQYTESISLTEPKQGSNKAGVYKATEEEKRAFTLAYIERWRKEEKERRKADGVPRIYRDTNYVVGSIPIQEGVSPSGTRTYTIPIQTAPDAKLSPTISLSYHGHMSVSGLAGYCWDLEGISKISLINSNLYYHSSTKAARSSVPNGLFSLDDNVLQPNPNGGAQGGYYLISASGHILVKKLVGTGGYATQFLVSYPNGVKATYGLGYDAQKTYPSYPIVEMSDIDGNKISFEYYSESTEGTYRIKQINYNYTTSSAYDSCIIFDYQEGTDEAIKYYAGRKTSVGYFLKEIVSKSCGDTLAKYNLDYLIRDNVHLLEQVRCSNGTDSLPPVRFEYGDPGYWQMDSTATLEQTTSFRFTTASMPDTVDCIYRRGKLIADSYNDGVVIYPNYPTYSSYIADYLTNLVLYRCDYSANQPLYVVPHIGNGNDGFPNTVDNSILAGGGFQTMEAVDVDGDGIDELVKVNLTGISNAKNIIELRVYKIDSDGVPELSTFFSVYVTGILDILFNECPFQRDYFWGDFKGNGTTQLLTIAYRQNAFGVFQSCYASLIDFSTQSVLSEEVLFDYEIQHRNRVFVMDMDGDGASELCRVTSDGLEMYRLKYDNTFDLDQTISGISLSTLDDNRAYFADINADGYVDLVTYSYPFPFANLYKYTGEEFISSVLLTGIIPITEQIMFIDINRDNYPDLVRVGPTGMNVRMNHNGIIFGANRHSSTVVTDMKGILPCNVVDYGSASCFVKVEGQYVKLFEYNCLSPRIRYLVSSTDSFGKVIHNTYGFLPEYSRYWTEYNYYTPTTSSGYSLKAIPIYILLGEASYLPGAITPIKETAYCYYDAVIHHRGLGFCGYGGLLSNSFRDTVCIRTEQCFNPEKRGVLSWMEVRDGISDASPLILVQNNTYGNYNTLYAPPVPRLTSSSTDNRLSGITTTLQFNYGMYNNPTRVITTYSDGISLPQKDTLQRSYSNHTSPDKYVLGCITAETRTYELDGDAATSWKEKTNYTYDSNFHPLTRKYYVGITPVNLVRETRWQYDSRGNVTSETSASYGSTEFVGDYYSYDASGRHILIKTSAIGLSTTYGGFNKYGNPTTTTDSHGNVTNYTYDSWGKITAISYPNGTSKHLMAAWGGAGLYTVQDTTSGKPKTVVHYDALGREVRCAMKRFDGQWQYVDKEYDLAGNLSRESLPYRGAAPSYWNTHAYDHYGRQTSYTEASGKVSLWSYSGTSVTSVIEGIYSSKTIDPSGNLISVSDAGGTISYSLRDDGQPSAVTAPGNVTTTFAYDAFGRKTAIYDPSGGTQTYAYTWNSNGTSQITNYNPNGTITTSRDKYGRITLVSRAGEFNTSYTYNSYGLLSAEQSTNGTGKEYTYDSFDRIVTDKETVPGNIWLQKSYSYGADGNVSAIQYQSQNRVLETEIYTYTNGHLSSVSLPNKTIWEIVSENDLGAPTEVSTLNISREYGYTAFGLPTYRKVDNGNLQEFAYQFDATRGNLLQRQDLINNTTETFCYDTLNRLAGIGSRQIAYANNGNISSIDGVGYMVYGDSSKPYQATGLLATSAMYVDSDAQSVSYTSFGRPSVISEGGKTVSYVYNGEGQRVKATVIQNSILQSTKYYVGGRYECEVTPVGDTERLYLGGDYYSAPVVLEKKRNQRDRIRLIGRDYQGSVTHIISDTGTLLNEYSYDPWGRLRDPATLAIYTPGSEPTLTFGRGFTGHEHLNGFGLINMNARLYDPFLGRFLSPDPYIQMPDFTQNFNRYSYALNNPLKYTDPNGEFFEGSIFTALFQLPVAILGGIVLPFFVGFCDTRLAGNIFEQVWTYYGEKVWNAIKIDAGQFAVDTDISFGLNALSLLSRFTWERKQMLLGRAFSHFRNNFEKNIDVEYYHGSTIINQEDKTQSGWGMTLGSYINGVNLDPEDSDGYLVEHEYGHTKQSKILGPAYLWIVGVPSIFGAISDYELDLTHHNREWYEVWANQLSYDYFKNHNYSRIVNDWPEKTNPLIQGPDLFMYPTLLYYKALIYTAVFVLF